MTQDARDWRRPRLTTFIIAVTMMGATLTLTVVWVLLYSGVSGVTERRAEEASREVADAAFACALTVMRTGGNAEAVVENCLSAGRWQAGEHGAYQVAIYPREGFIASTVAYDDDVRQAFERGRQMQVRSDETLRMLLPIRASEVCRDCHSGVTPGEMVGVLEVTHDLGPELSSVRENTLLLLLLAFPVPLIGAGLLAYWLGRRVRRSLDDVQRAFFETDASTPLTGAAPPVVDLGFREFNNLYGSLVSKLLAATRDLKTYNDVLADLLTSPEAARDWKAELSRIVVAVHERLPLFGLYFLFQPTPDIVEVEAFWYGSPDHHTRNRVTQTLQQAFEREGTRWELDDHVAVPNARTPALTPAEIERGFQSIHCLQPGVGHIIGVALLLDLTGVSAGVDLDAFTHERSDGVVRGLLSALVGVGSSLRTIARHTSELEYYATHDPLTGLYNSRMFWELLTYDVQRAGRLEDRLAVVIVDFDQFKAINDAYGHAFGDQFLREAGASLRELTRDGDVLARCGGDEFSITMFGAGTEQAYLVATRIVERFRDFKLRCPDGAEVGVTVSVGVAMYPDHATSSKRLFAMADRQMYKAKESGRNRIALPDHDDIFEVNEHLPEGGALVRDAIQNDKIVPYFQPILCLATGEVEAHEVLMRVKKNGSVVAAKDIVEVAEAMGLITTMDLITIEKAFQIVRDQDYRGQLFLNVSPKALVYKEFMLGVQELVTRYAIDPRSLIFELTERETVRNLTLIERFIRDLREKGFGFAVDDFGSGFSSFQYLRRFPLNLVKIDGEFVSGMAEPGSVDRSIVIAVAALARGLNIKTVAEFVEHEDVLEAVQEAGIDFAQGYHVGRPSPELVS